MQFSKKQIFILGGAIFVVVLIVALFMLFPKGGDQPKPVTLNFWGTDDKNQMDAMFAAYKGKHPNVTIKYQQLPEENYNQELIDKLAAGQGPDVFMVDNEDIPLYANKVYAPMATQYTMDRLRQDFPEVVAQDMACGSYICGLPLYVDTLALFYNRDYLDQASLVGPPRTWEDFQSYMPYLRVREQSGSLTRAGAAIGGAPESVSYAADLIYALLQQNSAVTSGAGGVGIAEQPAATAASFYLQFGNPGSTNFTWADSMGESLTALAAGKTAMAFGYYSDYLKLKAKSPYSSIGVAELPQTTADGQKFNVARYRAFAVSTLSKNGTAAWDAIIGLTTDPDIAKAYLDGAMPPANRTLIGQAINDQTKGVFARQALTARAPIHAQRVFLTNAFDSLINDIRSGKADTSRAARELNAKVRAEVNK